MSLLSFYDFLWDSLCRCGKQVLMNTERPPVFQDGGIVPSVFEIAMQYLTSLKFYPNLPEVLPLDHSLGTGRVVPVA